MPTQSKLEFSSGAFRNPAKNITCILIYIIIYLYRLKNQIKLKMTNSTFNSQFNGKPVKRQQEKHTELSSSLDERVQNILKDLAQFHGTENYYRADIFGIIHCTDGVQYLRESLACYWLTDVICSYQCSRRVKSYPFQVWKLKVDLKNSTAVVTMENGDGAKIVRQKIEYTDFPLPEITLWYQNKVIYLPSEH